MGEPVAGKFLLEILTKGMYSNPMHVYREYIQNSTDSIDKAVASGVISSSVAAFHIQIDGAKQRIIIHDNGYGIPAEKTREILLSIGDSDKNGMEVINSGGLYGKISIDALGKVHPETRNAALANMLELLRITENRYSGIPTMRSEFIQAGLPVPIFSVVHG